MTLEGKRLGQYHILHLLGSGGMGEVYLAEDARIGQQVAIKVSKTEAVYYPSNESTNDAFRLFQREAKAIAQLDHPHILPLYGYGEEHTENTILTYIVMPYRREGTLATWLPQRSSSRKLPVEDVIYLISQAADALQYSHDHHILHQDVKPSNFLIRSNKENPNRPDLLLADFGIAKLSTATVNASQTIRGTPAFMPPEQWRGQPVPASDQYALAVLAYSLLTGRLPFNGRLEEVMYQHINIRPQPPGNLNPTLSKEIDTVILKALEKRPVDRFPSVDSFAKALQQTTTNIQSLTLPAQGKITEVQKQQYEKTVPVMQHSSLSTFNPTRHISDPPNQQRSSSMKMPLLIGLILLILAGSVGYFFVRGTTSTTSSHALSTSTSTTGSNISSTHTATTGSQTSPTTSSLSVTYPPPNATLILSDPLSDNSKGYQWETKPDPGGVCAFTGGVYQVTETSQHTIEYCPAYQTDIHDNFVYEVQMNIAKGDVGGLLFKDNIGSKSYYFRCSADGYYTLAYYGDNAPNNMIIISSGSSSALNIGYNQPNLLAVMVQAGNISLYINRQLISQVHVGTYGDGYIGVFATDKTNQTVVIFSNAKVWSF